MQTKSLPAILGGSGRRVASEVAAHSRRACALLKSVPGHALKRARRACSSVVSTSIKALE